MCCAGCQAVCEAIVANGLADYYRHRQAMPERAGEGLPEALRELDAFDNAEFQRSFVRPLGGDEREADLILEGITCAACVWLNERHIGQLAGVTAVQVNYATRRARVRWHDQSLKLSAILAAVARIGYRAHPYDPDRAELIAQRERRTALWRLFVAGFGMMQVMMYAYPAYIAGEGEMSVSAANVMRWASMVLTFPVVLYSAAPFFRRAAHDLRNRHLGMDVPVALGIGAAFVASVWATLTGRGEVYFDSVTMFVFFLLGARYLEMLARQRAMRGAETLGRLVPSFARRLHPDGSVEERVPVSSLVAGDCLLLRPGEALVADGSVRDGESELNEAWLTGESLPVRKRAGDRVLSGSVNGSGVLAVLVEQVGEATRLAGIRRLMERARLERPRIVELADRVALLFTGVLLLLALAAAAFWWHVEPSRALEICVAVLVVSCPCALSLATPIALTVATDTMARAGLLVTRAHAIEALAGADHFVFDKTGTLTRGVLQVDTIVTAEGASEAQVLAIAGALELNSEHLIARAIVARASKESELRAAERTEIVPGQGVLGWVGGRNYALGRAGFVARLAGSARPGSLEVPDGASWIYLVEDGRWLGALGLSDQVRESVPALLDGLHGVVKGVSVFSGDAQAAVNAQLGGQALADLRGDLGPEDKQAGLLALQQRGRVVAMVGDGINDAPVLAQAQVSLAMAGGTELARQQADIILLGDDLAKILAGVRIARKARRVIRENLAWAFTYNVLAIPAAALGWVTPWMAGLGMGLSSLLVVLNALRIARGR